MAFCQGDATFSSGLQKPLCQIRILLPQRHSVLIKADRLALASFSVGGWGKGVQEEEEEERKKKNVMVTNFSWL